MDTKLVNPQKSLWIKNFRPSKKTNSILIGLIAGLCLLFWGFKSMHYAYTHESTDDAQIDGNIIPLRTTVTGYIDQIRFHDNQQVKKGDTLIIFDTTDLSAQVKQAEAALEAASIESKSGKEQVIASKFNKNATRFSLESAKGNIDVAQAREWEAETDFNRIKKIYAQGAATQQTFEKAKTTLEVAKSQLAVAQKQYHSSDAQVLNIGSMVNIHTFQAREAGARIKQVQAQLTLATSQYKHAFVTAPCNGIVSKKNVEAGQFVPSGTALATIINLSDIWITANFKETQLKDMHPGQPVDVEIDAYPELKLKGMVQSFCGATGTKFSILPAENATGNFIKITQRIPVRIAIRSNQCQKALLPGMNVVAEVKTR